uniref:Protein kinase domain-containing protein n=1 Tax=Angiostrongylus cantonensis TaxID=6313 RepID=A0A0K0CVE3_ANGCA
MVARMDINDMIVRLLNVGVPGCALVNSVKESELLLICQTARYVHNGGYRRNCLFVIYLDIIFSRQPSLVEVQPPIKMCEDIHEISTLILDVVRLFDRGDFPPMVNYLFRGEYVFRGHQNLECTVLFFSCKIEQHFLE